MAKKIGRPPTPQESGLAAAAALLAPDKTLDRIDGFAKYLLGLSALIASVITGFGVIGAGGLSASPVLFVPIVLFSISLGLAVSGLTPKLSTVAPSELNELARYYEAAIRRRHAFVWWAGMLFAAGILASPICVAIGKGWLAGSRIVASAQLVRTQTGRALTGTVEGWHLSQDECVRVKGVSKPDGTTLFDTVGRPQAGTAVIALNVQHINAAVGQVAINASVVPCVVPVELSIQ